MWLVLNGLVLDELDATAWYMINGVYTVYTAPWWQDWYNYKHLRMQDTFLSMMAVYTCDLVNVG